MENVVLISGMDGTNILFNPFLRTVDKMITIKIYDLNHDSNQAIDYQTQKIEQFIFDNFSDKPTIIIAESYSGLLIFNLLIKKSKTINIAKVIFIGGFLECPSLLARFAKWFDPNWAKILPDNILGYLLFKNWQTPELIKLFRQVLDSLADPLIQETFKQRLANIAQAKFTKTQHLLNIPCLYLQASQDNLVKSHNIRAFQHYFSAITIQQISGTHFLLQTNPLDCWQVIKNFIQKSKIN